MDTINKGPTKRIIIGMALVISMKFVLFFIAQHAVGNFLPWGYYAKTLIWIWLALVYVYATRIEKLKYLLWVEKNYSFWFYIISVIAIIGLVTVSSFIQQLLALIGVKAEHSIQLKEMLQYLHGRPVLLLFTCLTAGIVEELLFRGYLIPRLNMFIKSSSVTVIISALLFGIVHLSYGTAINIVIPIFVGLIFGFHYQKYRNLKVLIICHFLIDLSSLLVQLSH